jgi:hypothetical protein
MIFVNINNRGLTSYLSFNKYGVVSLLLRLKASLEMVISCQPKGNEPQTKGCSMKTALLIIAIVSCSSLALASPKHSQPKAAKPVAGAGEAFVQSFFDNWKRGQFEKMSKQVTPNEPVYSLLFVNRLTDTPISWKNLKIQSEKPTGDGWDVTFTLDVTDFESAFAGCRLNLKMPPSRVTNGITYRYTPAEFGIERFMNVRQTWHVVDAKPVRYISYEIDTGFLKGKLNVLNYFFVASNMRSIEDRPISPKNEEDAFAVTQAWFARTASCLGLSIEESQSQSLWNAVVELVKKGEPKAATLPYKPSPNRGPYN